MFYFSLSEIADRVGLKCIGNGALQIRGISSLRSAGKDQLSFCRGKAFIPDLQTSKAGAIILPPALADQYKGNKLISEDPTQALIDILHLFHPHEQIIPGIHHTAVVDPSVVIPPTASIGPHAVVEAGASIGDAVRVDAFVFIGHDVSLGAGCRIYPHSTIYHGVQLGDNVTVHANSVIGADGFGYHRTSTQESWRKIPQVGSVRVGNSVEIGASSTIDRGALDDTVIGDGVKIDNQVLIGHNASIGDYSVIAGCTGIAGSTQVGKNCMFGGGCGISDNIKITDGVVLLGQSGVASSIDKPGIYASGTGLMPASKWRRLLVRLKKLDKIVKLFELRNTENKNV